MNISFDKANLSYFWIAILLFQLNVQSQSVVKSFFNLSTPEKCWVIFHPFKAKRAYLITREALRVTDSVIKTGVVGSDLNGGQADAFKHSYWMARLSGEIGTRAALKLGKAHEKGNYRSFKKGKPEDGSLPDKPSSDMDLFNNEVGTQIALHHMNVSGKAIAGLIIRAIKNGTMKILKKDLKGNFLTCSGKIIRKESFSGKWENDKCLIDSNCQPD